LQARRSGDVEESAFAAPDIKDAARAADQPVRLQQRPAPLRLRRVQFRFVALGTLLAASPFSNGVRRHARDESASA